MTFGQLLKQLRKQAGLSQAQLAAQLSLSRSTIAKWEADLGIPDIQNLRALSQLFNISIQELLGDAQASTFPLSVKATPPRPPEHPPVAKAKTRSTHWKPRFVFLLSAYLLLSLCFMLIPISLTQVGLPDLTEVPIAAITFGGNRPKVSTRDPALATADPAVIAAQLSNIQTALEETAFYCRTYPLNPLRQLSVNGSWILIETDTERYWFGDYKGLFFVEIDGARRYYKLNDSAVNARIRAMQSYFVELESSYDRAESPS